MTNLDPGSRLGPYAIVSRIGAGGMGEVWRATDTRLERTVAIKILPPEFAQNAQLKVRFEREAKAISQLNHPHICTVHDVGEENGIHYLVMELLEGETLAERLTKGALPVEQALGHAIEIASALDRAHREGIIHRDLKPANIVLTKSGAKLLDFGLAKSGITQSGSSIIDAATHHKALTQEGTVVGTFQYMAPEQVSGEAVDARSDIFAFGAVLYEMLTGSPAFRGKNRTSIVTAILSGQPQPISAVQPLTPPALERVVKTCLQKDPDDRWQTAHDVMLELKWIEEGGSQAGVAAPVVHRRRVRERAAWSVAMVASLLAVVLAIAYMRLLRSPAPVLRTSINPPPKVTLALSGENIGSLTVSPDGRLVTFAAKGEDGKTMLWLRPFDSATGQPLAGTENAIFPFWSPDSRFIAFFSEGKLRKIDLTGAPPLTICDAPNNPRSGSWNEDGIIIFSPISIGPIYKVAAAGGQAVPVTKLEVATGETTHRWATFLPDGRHFLYMVGTHSAGTKSETNAIYAGSLDDSRRTLLLHARSNTVYASGHLLYLRDRVLIAQPFDPRQLRFTGDPVPVAQNVHYETAFFRAAFGISGQGTLVYHSGSTNDVAVMHFYDRNGKQLQAIGDSAQYRGIAISPDARRVALVIEDPSSGTNSIWIHDIARNVRSRFTFGETDQGSPVWSPDGSRIAYSTVAKGGIQDIVLKQTSGNAREEPLVSDATVKQPSSWSSDGRYLAYTSTDYTGKNKDDIWIVPLSGDRKSFPFIRTQFNENAPSFSPDGHWIAYSSDESGRNEVYIVPFPGPGGKWQVSPNGGVGAGWSRDGREILFGTLDRKVMAVPVSASGSTVTIGAVQPLFDFSSAAAGDFAADHSRAILATPISGAQDPSITVVTNWPATLKK